MTSRGHDPTRQQQTPQDGNVLSHSDLVSDQSRGAASTRPLNSASGVVTNDWFPKTARYQPLGEPISGGMGVVFRALDSHLDIEVAIKRIRPEFTTHQELIKRFEREAKTQVRLRHPNLVAVRDFAQDDLGPYIVMDWIKGRSLAQALREDGPFEWQRAATIISKVAAALQVAHDAGIIHRDIKPANILLDEADEPHVTDFGLVRLEASHSVASETMTGALLGTVDFVAPEQLEDPRNASIQSDIWSLGATLYRLVTNRSVRGMRESLIPEPIREIVVRCMEESVSQRYRTMAELSVTMNALKEVSRSASHRAIELQSAPPAATTVHSFSALLNARRCEIGLIQQKALNAIEFSDYAHAVELLDQLPAGNRDPKIYEETVRRRNRIQELRNKIEESVKEMELTNLDVAVLELLELTPHDEDLESLMQQLPRGNGGRLIASQLVSTHKLPVLPHGPSESNRPQKPINKKVECSIDQWDSSAPALLDRIRKFFFD